MRLSPKLQSGIEASLLAVIAAFVLAVGFVVFRTIFFPGDANPSDAFQGAFLGAFFSFLFVRGAEALTKLSDRKAKARSALIALQHKFNVIMNIINDELYHFKQLETFGTTLSNNGPIAIFGNRFGSIPQIDDLLMPLNNIDLINELSILNTEIRKINTDLEMFQLSYDRIADAFTGGVMNEATYLYNANDAVTRGKEVEQFVFALLQDVITSFCAIRLLSASDTIFGKIVRWTTQDKYPKDFEQRRKVEREKLMEEKDEINADKTRAVQKMRTQISDRQKPHQ